MELSEKHTMNENIHQLIAASIRRIANVSAIHRIFLFALQYGTNNAEWKYKIRFNEWYVGYVYRIFPIHSNIWNVINSDWELKQLNCPKIFPSITPSVNVFTLIGLKTIFGNLFLINGKLSYEVNITKSLSCNTCDTEPKILKLNSCILL